MDVSSAAEENSAPSNPSPAGTALRWDLFCRVIDNLGDIGVCWRLAADLAQRGHQVRLVVDDLSALAWMAPQGHCGVQVLHWLGTAQELNPALADVVVEAFGCDPPPAYVDAMQPGANAAPPVWVNLEYLSAEGYVERCHALPSPQRGGLQKWFFYPGFTPATGGLIREADLAERQAAFNPQNWLQTQGLARLPQERVVSLFCYDNPALPQLLQALAQAPTLLLLAGPQAQAQVAAQSLSAWPHLRWKALPWLTQRGFDELLWACDLNFVRGEDSLVRALWAGQPFVWQAYPQQDLAHHAKVNALLANWGSALLEADMPGLGADTLRLWQHWNGLEAAAPRGAFPELALWQQQVQLWRQKRLQSAPLAEQLQSFVQTKRRSLQRRNG